MSFWTLFIIGAGVIGLDLMVASIHLSLIGLAFIETGVLVAMGFIDELNYQLAVVAALSMINFFALQKPLKAMLNKTDVTNDTFTPGGYGKIVIHDGQPIRVHYQGTTWPIINLAVFNDLKHDQEVLVVNIHKNQARIARKPENAL